MDKILAPIKSRIIQFIEHQGIKRDDFFNRVGIASSNFRGLGASSELGGDKIVKILTEYPDINSEWLLLGFGEMLKSNDKNEDNHSQKGEWYKELLAEKEMQIANLNQKIGELRNELRKNGDVSDGNSVGLKGA